MPETLPNMPWEPSCPNVEVCFISLDEETQKELKDAIKSIIEKRLDEIEDELENL